MMQELKDEILNMLRDDFYDEFGAAFVEKTGDLPADDIAREKNECMNFLQQAGLQEEYLW
ncbi:hypothetical protein ACFQZT_29460 [Paenibacillus sp. GCM10027628]|uniref:hypothetical protein n=1 Tax=Paenibacillus sp. GCM10027628 TaxID=3273413 RepID=UPI003644ECB4